MKKQEKKPGRPRRWAALAMAAAALWMAGQTADWGEAGSALLRSGQVVSKLLELELGRWEPEESELNPLAALAVEQSPLLARRREEIAGAQAASSGEESADREQETVPATDPADAQPAGERWGEEESAEVSAECSAEGAEEPEPQQEQTGTEEKETALDLSGVTAEQLEVDNHTSGQNAEVEKYWEKTPSLALRPAEEGPQILLMHTHATEAYTMADGDNYEESDESRTTDENYNMIRVGEEMKAVFEELGFSVLHDKTTYDYPGYNGSYGRSLAGVQTYLEQYPTIQVVLDVHRDALIASDGTVYAKTAVIGSEEVAQVMLVVGTDDGGLTHPDWRNNYTLALKLQAAMLAEDTALPRTIDLRSQRFNQHLTPGSLLVEVGTSGNTLRQALAGARLFARAAGEVYQEYVDK